RRGGGPARGTRARPRDRRAPRRRLRGRPRAAPGAARRVARGDADRRRRRAEARAVIDLLLRNARLQDGALVDLAIDGGRFVSGGEARETIDVEGRLVTPPLVDCHLHLDASLTAGRPRFNESGTLIEGIHVWGELKESLTADEVCDRAREI